MAFPSDPKNEKIKQNQAVLGECSLLLRKCKDEAINILVCLLPSQMTKLFFIP